MVTSEILDDAAEQLQHDIMDFRKEMEITPIRTEAVSLSEAASLCTIGTTGNDVSTLLALQEQGDRANSDDQKIEKYFMYAIIIMVIGIIPLIYHMVMKG